MRKGIVVCRAGKTFLPPAFRFSLRLKENLLEYSSRNKFAGTFTDKSHEIQGGKEMIMYSSTRGGGEKINAAKAVIKGIAEDKGLFVPDRIPVLEQPLEALCGKTYQEIAEKVIGAFFQDYTGEEIHDRVIHAYDDKFSAEEIVPMAKIGGGQPVYFLELYRVLIYCLIVALNFVLNR